MKKAGFLCLVGGFAAALLCAPVALSAEGSILLVVSDTHFDDMQYFIAGSRLSASGFDVVVASPDGGPAISMGGLRIESDVDLWTADEKDYLSLVVVGGTGIKTLSGDNRLASLVSAFARAGKTIAGAEYATAVLAEAAVLKGTVVSAWPTDAKSLAAAGAEYAKKVVSVSGQFVTGMGGTDENSTAWICAYIAHLQGLPYTEGAHPSDIGFTLDKTGTRFVLTHNGLTRTGAVFLPADYNPDRLYSLVFGLHGTAGTGDKFRLRGFDSLAGELDFIMVYPDGYNGDWDILPGRTTRFDDAGLISTLNAEFSARFSIDPARKYVTGHSLGGFMAYRLGRDLSDRITAIAPVSGLMYTPAAGDLQKTALSLLHVHARNDMAVPFDGDPMYGVPVSVYRSVDLWRASVGASEQALPYTVPKGAVGKVWQNENNGSDVVLAEFASGGHVWQSGVTDLVADFFYNHPARPARIKLDTAPVEPYSTIGTVVRLNALVSGEREIERVVFFADGKIVGEDTSPPYTAFWNALPRGSYIFGARAFFSDGSFVNSTMNPHTIAVEADLARSARIFSSSAESTDVGPENAIDGDPSTRWASLWTDGEWISMDLGEKKKIHGLTLVWEDAHALSYRIQVSADGTVWRNVLEKKESSGGVEYLDFEPEQARFIRLTGLKRATVWGYSLWDILVH